MNWVSISTNHLEDREAAAMVAALKSAALGAGQDDPVPGLIQAVVDVVRAAVGTCPRYTLNADTATVPKSLAGLTAREVVRQAKGRLGLQLSRDERETAARDERTLSRVRSCHLAVEEPDTPLSRADDNLAEARRAHGGAVIARQRTRVATSEQLNGLV